MKIICFTILFFAYGVTHFSCAQILSKQIIDEKIKLLDSNYSKKPYTSYFIIGVEKLKFQAKSKNDYEIGMLQYDDSQEDRLKIDSVLKLIPSKFLLDVDLGTGIVYSSLHGISTDIISIRFAHKQNMNLKLKTIKKIKQKLRKTHSIQKAIIYINNKLIPHKEACKIIDNLSVEDVFCVESEIGYITKRYYKKYVLTNVWIITNDFL